MDYALFTVIFSFIIVAYETLDAIFVDDRCKIHLEIVRLLWASISKLPRRHPGIGGRIVGGTPIDIKDRPYQLSLRYQGSHNGGAALISAEWALSAAHCVLPFPKEDLSVRAGSSNHDSGGEVVNVAETYTHPHYNVVLYSHDISIVKLSKPIDEKFGQPATLPALNEVLDDNTPLTLTGWGRIKDGGVLSKELLSVQLVTLPQKECENTYEGHFTVTAAEYCAGSKEEGQGECEGDSGGPVTVDGTDKIVGLSSFGLKCGEKAWPNIHVRVAAVRDFIKETTGV